MDDDATYSRDDGGLYDLSFCAFVPSGVLKLSRVARFR
jgi:hypothetical protein